MKGPAMPDSDQETAEGARAVRRDTAYLITVVISGLALIGGILAVGLSARAVNRGELAPGVAASPVATHVPLADSGQVNVNLKIAERDLSIQMPATPVVGGSVKLVITNAGPSPHELLIFKTDLPEGQLPVVNGIVDETSSHITKVFDTGNNIDPGTTRIVQANLPAGNYVLVCNLPGHYLAGMHAQLKVT
jgi:uncharacterized cupredoxin-like copper-binding protein